MSCLSRITVLHCLIASDLKPIISCTLSVLFLLSFFVVVVTGRRVNLVPVTIWPYNFL